MRKMPNVAMQLQEAMDQLYGFKRQERKETKVTAVVDFLMVVFAPDNLFAGLTLLLFVVVMIIAAMQSAAGLGPDYIGVVIGTMSGAVGVWFKLRSKTRVDEQSISLVDTIMDRQFEYEKLQHEFDLKKSQLNFFTQELIGLIGKCEPERLQSIDLALQALILDKEGIVHKDMKAIKSLLAQRQAEEEVTIKKIDELLEILPKNGILNHTKRIEMEETLQKAETLQASLTAREYQYDRLMSSLNICVYILDTTGVITEANDYACRIIPGLIDNVGQHWTWNMKDRPSKQLKAMVGLMGDALIGKSGKLKFINYMFSDGTVVKKLFIRAVPSCMGDIVTHVFVIVDVTNSNPLTTDDDVKVIRRLETKASASLDVDRKSAT